MQYQTLIPTIILRRELLITSLSMRFNFGKVSEGPKLMAISIRNLNC